jgi:hypothetical protein
VHVAETIEQSGRRVGAHLWVASRLFEALGRWSGAVDDPRARSLLAVASRRFGWLAELWWGLLPGLLHLPAAELVAPPASAPDLAARLEQLDDAPDGERIAGLIDDALPCVLADLDAHLAVTTPVTDGPTVRVIGLARADVQAMLDALSSWAASRPRSAG